MNVLTCPVDLEGEKLNKSGRVVILQVEFRNIYLSNMLAFYIRSIYIQIAIIHGLNLLTKVTGL